jgi:hypothetical protein
VEAHAHFLDRLREHVPRPHLVAREGPSSSRLTLAGITSGIAGGVMLAVPLIIYDWAKASHSALELPMAVTGWLFGLNHFAPNGYDWWPIVIGALFMIAFFGVSGLAYAAVAERVYHVRTVAGNLALGAVWSFVSFIFVWYMLLPIARDGAPFRETAAAGAFVAPNWVWILGFALSGLATGVCYRMLRGRTAAQPATAADATAKQAA